MPALYDKPAVFAQYDVEDTNRFQQLDFYLVMNEVAVFQRKKVKPVLVAVLVSAIVTVAPGTDWVVGEAEVVPVLAL